MASTVGRWMISKAMTPSELLRVELDDELFAHGDVDVLAQREVPDGDLEALGACLQPRGHLPVERVHVVADDDHRPRLLLEGDDVALAHAVARDVDAPAIHRDVAVAHELAGLVAARAPPGTEGDVVEALLE